MVRGEARGVVARDRVPVVDHRGVEEVEAEVVRLRQPRDLSRVSRGTRLRRQAQIFVVTQQDAKESNTTITNTLSIEIVDARVLFDFGSTHSFLSPSLASRIGVEPKRLETPLVVSTPLGRTWEVD